MRNNKKATIDFISLLEMGAGVKRILEWLGLGYRSSYIYKGWFIKNMQNNHFELLINRFNAKDGLEPVVHAEYKNSIASILDRYILI